MVGRDYQYNDSGSERQGREERINLDPINQNNFEERLASAFSNDKQTNKTKQSVSKFVFHIGSPSKQILKMSSRLYQEIFIFMRPAFVEGVRVRFSQRKKLHFQSILTHSTGQVIKNYEYIPEEMS